MTVIESMTEGHGCNQDSSATGTLMAEILLQLQCRGMWSRHSCNALCGWLVGTLSSPLSSP